ncbi:unnamed protein product [Orchesella dallaii]|uniref:Uncharacterized protein n=1 Tax=Orchesella dallaii TaxID=48710 RepID=A0ABP1QJZ7_9HEXA
MAECYVVFSIILMTIAIGTIFPATVADQSTPALVLPQHPSTINDQNETTLAAGRTSETSVRQNKHANGKTEGISNTEIPQRKTSENKKGEPDSDSSYTPVLAVFIIVFCVFFVTMIIRGIYLYLHQQGEASYKPCRLQERKPVEPVAVVNV